MYLSYLYLTVSAFAERYGANVSLWQFENELNIAPIALFDGQRWFPFLPVGSHASAAPAAMDQGERRGQATLCRALLAIAVDIGSGRGFDPRCGAHPVLCEGDGGAGRNVSEGAARLATALQAACAGFQTPGSRLATGSGTLSRTADELAVHRRLTSVLEGWLVAPGSALPTQSGEEGGDRHGGILRELAEQTMDVAMTQSLQRWGLHGDPFAWFDMEFWAQVAYATQAALDDVARPQHQPQMLNCYVNNETLLMVDIGVRLIDVPRDHICKH